MNPFDVDMQRDDTDTQSELSEEEENGVALPMRILDLVVPTVKTLLSHVKNFPNIPDEQRVAWDKSASRVDKASLPSYKFALVGRTGSGKSTLVNCLLGCSLLPSSAAGACTAAITEIAYADVNMIEATVTFYSEEHWRQELEKLLQDMKEEKNTSDSPSDRSQEKLCGVYPRSGLPQIYPHDNTNMFSLRQFNTEDLARLTPATLLEDGAVRNRLGTSFDLPPTDSDNFRANLEEYLSSSVSTKGEILWPLVEKVQIRGRFSVLSSGIVLVDLPGHGDHDDVRNDAASEYIRKANGVILVVDAKRAQDDRDTLEYLRRRLNALTLQGLSVEENLILAATGTDTSIGDNEVRLERHDREKLELLIKELRELRLSIRPPKKSKPPKHEELIKQAQLENKIKEREREKALLLANVRIAGVRGAIQEFFKKTHSNLFPEAATTPKLPIFCLGSQDYLALTTYVRTPSVFHGPDETEIPQLINHLESAAESRRLKWATRLLEAASTLSENVHSYFSAGRHPGRLPFENKAKALALINDLEKANLVRAGEGFNVIAQELHRLEEDLKKTVKKAAVHSPQVLADFARATHGQTYKACMRFNGIHNARNLNHLLTRKIQLDIQVSWNVGVNYRIPMTLEQATEDLEQSSLKAIGEIIEALDGQGSALEDSIVTAKQSIDIEGLLNDMLVSAKESFSVEKRGGIGSCGLLLQKALIPHYQSISKETGSGAYVRMKTASTVYLQENGEVIFDTISSHIMKLLHDAFSKVKRQIRTELQHLTTVLRLSLVEEVNLPPDHKEAKDRILRLTLENRPAFAVKRIDLADRRRSLGFA
ncbi:hypothetical protein B0H11DRAFT_2060165 [Mycena galericulata]|nr:hypothetical protein B0H11DRAFT_2060165 [Mycena galericulata]